MNVFETTYFSSRTSFEIGLTPLNLSSAPNTRCFTRPSNMSRHIEPAKHGDLQTTSIRGIDRAHKVSLFQDRIELAVGACLERLPH